MAEQESPQAEIERLRAEVERLRNESMQEGDALRRTHLARHDQRPYTSDYIERIFQNFSEIHGDRRYADDPAIVAGMAVYHGDPVMIVGQQKGRDLKQRQLRNFGCPHPEGYRKAMRAMKLAEKFSRPVICFIDTQGAYPGIGAEERGQAEAIAYNLREMSRLEVPIVACVIGEGGSGGALGIAVANYVLMLENAVYSVISPEGCSAILWKDQDHVDAAANALKITAKDLLSFGIIDEIVPEPPEGAHTNHAEAASLLDGRLKAALDGLRGKSRTEMQEHRYAKFRRMGAVETVLQTVQS
jgi:acetyl-CoA carboxylase carboxyl transferase subunit alpha